MPDLALLASIPFHNMINETTDIEFIILENIYGSSSQDIPLRQRDLAQIAGASLGMTNAILKRLAKKGWISIKKLNSRNIQYVITLEGINEIFHRSYGYFKRTIRNVVFFKDRIDEVVNNAKKKNYTALLLVGISDLEFILEHSCQRQGLDFLTTQDPAGPTADQTRKFFLVYAENIAPLEQRPLKKNVLYLSRIALGSKP
jgi:DNA-binding MarR family transcriptional regulator